MINHYTVSQIVPLTEEAVEWINQHVELDWQGPAQVGSPIVVNHQHVDGLVEGYVRRDEDNLA